MYTTPTRQFTMYGTTCAKRFGGLCGLAAASIIGASMNLGVAALELKPIGRYSTGVFDGTATEISAYDGESKRLFVLRADIGAFDVVDLKNPAEPILLRQVDIAGAFTTAEKIASPNSVAVSRGLVAVAVQISEEDNTQHPGLAAFFDLHGELIDTAPVGALPDMLTFTPDGERLLVANEGEPNQAYTFDPEGSVSIIKVERLRDGKRLAPGQVRHATFERFNNRKTSLLASGVRVFGPNATVAQDLEPEYIAVSPDSTTAYVTLQENNAIAEINVNAAFVRAIRPLGYKDWRNSGLDASDRDNSISIRPWPVFGIYQPDAIAAYVANGETYLVTANEGDARDYAAFTEEVRVRSLALDPLAFPHASLIRENANLGRLNVTSTMGDPDGDGDYDALYTLGARSFSIWKADSAMAQVFDSGSDFEVVTSFELPIYFNSSNDSNDSFDSRSDNKGPEPEGIAVGEVNGRIYTFVSLERIGGVMVYDVSTPATPSFVTYINTRDFTGDPETDTAGDLGPEGLVFVSASESATGKPLLIVSHELSGSVAILEVVVTE